MRSWDLIPTGAFVTEYTGKRRARQTQETALAPDSEEEDSDSSDDDDSDDEEHDRRHEDEYTFDLAPRPYSECEKVKLPLLPPEDDW